MIFGCDRLEAQATAPESATQITSSEQASGYDIPPLPEPGFDLERYERDLKTLSSDEFEGRAPGARGERRDLHSCPTRRSSDLVRAGSA